MRFQKGVAAFAALFALAASGREPNVDGFKSYAMPGYTIITHDEGAARRVPTHIGMIDGVLTQLLHAKTRLDSVPTYIVVAPQNLWIDYLQPNVRTVSEFVPGRFVNYLLINKCNCDISLLRISVYHEYTHLFLHTQFRGILPSWFDEGMAELVDGTQFRGSQVTLGRSAPANFGWMPLEQLLRVEKSTPGYRSAAFMLSFHDQSWALVHRGIVADPAFGKQMFAYLEALNALKPVDEAVQSSFGMPIAQLNREQYQYASSSNFKTILLDVETQPVALTPGRKMSELESLELLADVMFVSGFQPERLAEVIAAARRVAPDAPGVQVLRMRRAALIRNDQALEVLLGEIEPHLSDPKVARGVGLALFERLNDQRPEDPMSAEQRIAFQQRAQELLERALRAQQDTEAAWAFGMLSATTKQQRGFALQHLFAASESVPMNADLAMATALVYESWEQPKEAMSYLADTARFSRSAEQRTWARTRLEEAKKSITQ